MLKQCVIAVAAAGFLSIALVAQDKPTPRPATAAPQPAPASRPPQPATPADQPPAPRPPEPPGQPVNVKLEITITDQAEPGNPTRKIVTMIVADRSAGSVRSNGAQSVGGQGFQPVSINVDATPMILRDGLIRLQFGLEYQPRPSAEGAQTTVPASRMSQINERLTVILQEGKPLVIAQAADPGSDRKITVELHATVLR